MGDLYIPKIYFFFQIKYYMLEQHDKSKNILIKNVPLQYGDIFYIKLHNSEFYFCDENGDTTNVNIKSETDSEYTEDYQDLMNMLNSSMQSDNPNNNKNRKNNQVIVLGNGYLKSKLVLIGGVKHVPDDNSKVKLTINKYQLSNNISKRWVIYQNDNALKITNKDIERYLECSEPNKFEIFRIIFTEFGLDVIHHKSIETKRAEILPTPKLLESLSYNTPGNDQHLNSNIECPTTPKNRDIVAPNNNSNERSLLEIKVENPETEITVNIDDKNTVPNLIDQIVQPFINHVVEPIVNHVVDPIVNHVVEPFVEHVVEPIVDNVVEPIVDNVVEPFVEHVAEPISKINVQLMVDHNVKPNTEISDKVNSMNNENNVYFNKLENKIDTKFNTMNVLLSTEMDKLKKNYEIDIDKKIDNKINKLNNLSSEINNVKNNNIDIDAKVDKKIVIANSSLINEINNLKKYTASIEKNADNKINMINNLLLNEINNLKTTRTEIRENNNENTENTENTYVAKSRAVPSFIQRAIDDSEINNSGMNKSNIDKFFADINVISRAINNLIKHNTQKPKPKPKPKPKATQKQKSKQKSKPKTSPKTKTIQKTKSKVIAKPKANPTSNQKKCRKQRRSYRQIQKEKEDRKKLIKKIKNIV
jgi:hypothetical protein